MAAVSAQDAAEALVTHAHPTEDGRWWFSRPDVTHSRGQALDIAMACLTLGVPVDDRMSGRAWCLVVRRLTALEERLAALEDRP